MAFSIKGCSAGILQEAEGQHHLHRAPGAGFFVVGAALEIRADLAGIIPERGFALRHGGHAFTSGGPGHPLKSQVQPGILIFQESQGGQHIALQAVHRPAGRTLAGDLAALVEGKIQVALAGLTDPLVHLDRRAQLGKGDDRPDRSPVFGQVARAVILPVSIGKHGTQDGFNGT